MEREFLQYVRNLTFFRLYVFEAGDESGAKFQPLKIHARLEDRFAAVGRSQAKSSLFARSCDSPESSPRRIINRDERVPRLASFSPSITR